MERPVGEWQKEIIKSGDYSPIKGIDMEEIGEGLDYFGTFTDEEKALWTILEAIGSMGEILAQEIRDHGCPTLAWLHYMLSDKRAMLGRSLRNQIDARVGKELISGGVTVDSLVTYYTAEYAIYYQVASEEADSGCEGCPFFRSPGKEEGEIGVPEVVVIDLILANCMDDIVVTSETMEKFGPNIFAGRYSKDKDRKRNQ